MKTAEQWTNAVIGTLAVDQCAVTFGTARGAWARCSLPSPLLSAHCTKCNSPLIINQCTNFMVFDVVL